MTRSDRAAAFRALHHDGLLILPNAWDAVTARIAEAAGAKAAATTSAGVAWALGWRDGDAVPPGEMVAAVGRIARVVSVPVSADMEGGYSDNPAAVGALAEALWEAGAVGVNIEDGTGEPALLAAKIRAIRAAVPEMFVNARTDVWLAGIGAPEGRLDEALARAALYLSLIHI